MLLVLIARLPNLSGGASGNGTHAAAFEWLASLRHHISSSSYLCADKRCTRADAIALPPNLRLSPQLDNEQPEPSAAPAAATHLHARLDAVRVQSLEHSFVYDAEYAGLAPAHCAEVTGHAVAGVTPMSASLSQTLSDRALFVLAHALSSLRLGLLRGPFFETIQTLAQVQLRLHSNLVLLII